jgi:hypothetical protein
MRAYGHKYFLFRINLIIILGSSSQFLSERATLVMAMDKNLIAAVIVAQQLFASYFIFFDDKPTKYEQKSRKKREQELTPYKRNVSVKYSMPTTVLVPQ